MSSKNGWDGMGGLKFSFTRVVVQVISAGYLLS